MLVPTKVFAIELISSPETPKSHILISPLVFARMLDGLMSNSQLYRIASDWLTSVDDPMHIIQVYQSLQDRLCDRTDNVDRNKAATAVDLV